MSRRIRRAAALIMLAVLFLSAGCAEEIRFTDASEMSGRFVSNPRGVSGIGDPFVLPDGGRYHVFATGAQIGFFHWISDDLIHFERDKALKNSVWVRADYKDAANYVVYFEPTAYSYPIRDALIAQFGAFFSGEQDAETTYDNIVEEIEATIN